MIKLILLLCFNPLYAENPIEFCLLSRVALYEDQTIKEYCGDRREWHPAYDMTVCREFDGSDHDKELLR